MRILPMLAAAVLAGCSISRPYPDQRFLTLEAPTLDASDAVDPPRPIRVARARIEAPFGSRALQYRPAPGELRPSYYHRWADDPGAIIAGAAARALDESGAFVVLDDAVGVDTLTIRVDRLVVDLSSGEPEAVLTARTTLVDPSGVVLLTRRFDGAAPVSEDAPETVVRAWSVLLGDLLGEFFASGVAR